MERFIDNSDQTIMDTKTGLMWQKKDVGPMSWQEALDYAHKLRLAGHDDWRLPSVEELFALLDFSKYGPTSSFPGMPSKWFWSSSLYAPDSNYVWRVSFSYGSVYAAVKYNVYYVRCVRKGSEKD